MICRAAWSVTTRLVVSFQLRLAEPSSVNCLNYGTIVEHVGHFRTAGQFEVLSL